MNIKSFLSILFMLSLAQQISAMAPQAGTVINPLHQATGQFTISGVNQAKAQASGLAPIITHIGQANSRIAQPVIISFAAGNAPWWALAIGTGYLLIAQCDINNPALLSSCIAGAGYAAGSQTVGLMKKIFSNEHTLNATTAALATSCFGISCVADANLVQDAFFAAAQAMGVEAIVRLTQQLLVVKQSSTLPAHSASHNNSNATAGLIDGASNAINIHLQVLFAELLKCYNPASLLKILLYEQAYRLASNGYQAAYDLCIQLQPEYTFLDHRKLACAII